MGLNNRIIIGIAGKAGSGKDTIANYLSSKHRFCKFAFANALKEYIGRQLFGLEIEQIYGDRKEVIDERYNKSPRYILQEAGSYLRIVYPDIWVDKLFAGIQSPIVGNVVISDARHLNELHRIKAEGGIIWLVKRVSSGAKNGIPNHVSEHEFERFNDYDAVFENDSDLDSLYAAVESELRRIIK